jgi:hypothetical protein
VKSGNDTFSSRWNVVMALRCRSSSRLPKWIACLADSASLSVTQRRHHIGRVK